MSEFQLSNFNFLLFYTWLVNFIAWVGLFRQGRVMRTGIFWETWQTKLTGNTWQASNGAQFSLISNTLRPAGWTSGDAAGLPMFPALVRYDECLRGRVEHALRLVVKRTRLGPIYPATHAASVGRTTELDILTA